MKNNQEPETVPVMDARGFNPFHPGTWSMRYRPQALNVITTFVVLAFVILLTFFIQKHAVVREAESSMRLYTEAKAKHMEDFFRSVSNQISVFSSDAGTVEAMREFSEEAAGIEQDQYMTSTAGSLEEMTSSLKGFYASEVIPSLPSAEEGSLQPDRFLTGDNKQNILQFLYLADNTRPLSQKYAVNRASDGSLYSETHSMFHPGMPAFARQAGISDILLVDYASGYVVYSMKKNIDFATNVYRGPFSNSAMADAYLEAAAAVSPGIVRFTDQSLYLPALLRPTVFASAPVFDGGRLLGAVIFAIDVQNLDRLLSAGITDDGKGSSGMKAYLVGPDLSYRSDDPDFENDPEDYLDRLAKAGGPLADLTRMSLLHTTALTQKLDYQKFTDAFSKAEGTLTYTSATGEKSICTFKVLDNPVPQWMLCTRMDTFSLFGPVRRMVWLMCLLSAAFLLAVYYTGRYFNIPVFGTIVKLRDSLLSLKDGNTGNHITAGLQNEMGDTAEAYNQLSDKMNDMLTFISEISKENFEAEWNYASEQDCIGRTLNELKENLMLKKSEEIKQKSEEHIRSWNTQGIALFNDILRKDNDNLEKLSLNVVRNLIEYLRANQGGLFLMEGEDKEQKLNLVASIAYDKRKFHKKTIEVGEGLAGACVLEKQSIVLNKIPDDYIEITSGLGGARPGSLMIVPLKKDDVVYGVIEMASFNPFPEHEVEFAEKVAENITDTITNVRLNLQNMQLLERFRVQEEEMKAQDEELRQNIEELQSTHEQMERMKEKEKEQTDRLIKEIEDNRKLLIDVLDNIPGKIFVKDENGVLLLLNSEVAKVYHKKVEELIGTSDFDNHPHEQAKEYRAKELEILAKGGETYIQEETLTGEMRYLRTTKMPFKIATTGKTGLMGIQMDVTDFVRIEQENKEKEEELRQNIEELKSTQEQMEQLKQQEIEKKEEMLKKIEDNQRLLIDVLDNIPGKIFVKDENGVLLLLNSEVAKVYNKKVEELIGTSDFDNHPHEQAKEYRAKELEILAKGGETYIQEETLTGEMRYLRTTKMPFKIATTGKTGLMGIQMDVTDFIRIEQENKEKEEELRQNIEELKSTQEQVDQIKQQEIEKKEQMLKEIGDNRKLLIDVLDNIPGKIFVKDENGVLLLLNSEVAKVYHKKVEELIGTSDFDNHPHDQAKEYRAKELEIMAKGGETYIQEETLTGEMRYLRTTKMPFKIATTGKTGLMGIQMDVTDFVRIEQENKEKEEELRQNIEELKSTQEQMDQIKQQEIEKKEQMLKEIENNRRLLLNVLDQIPGKIFVKDHNGVLLLLNSEVARVYSKKVDELIGTSDFDNHPREEATAYRAKELEIMEKGAETYIQEESLTGEMRYLKTTKMPFYLPHLDKTGLLGFQIDVTDQVTKEEKISELTNELEEMRKKQKVGKKGG